jgi:hypothetical protein
MKRPKAVKLLHLPEYTQGDLLDSLCTYNACATLLCAVLPQYKASVGQWSEHEDRRRKALDPLVKSAMRVGELPQHVIARWFCRGMYVREAHRLLNRAMLRDGHATRFLYREEDRSDRTFERIAQSIDRGLPVVVGWLTADLGNHAVVVEGYSRGHSRWLFLRDSGGDERITWESLRATMKTRLQVTYVDDRTHRGPRPDRVCEWTKRTGVQRWGSREGVLGYFDLDDRPVAVGTRDRIARRP